MTGLHVWVRVGHEDYALSVSNAVEVADVGEITPVPGASAAILGVRNLRGKVLPVVDLAVILQLSGGEHCERIVIAEEAGRRAALAVSSVVGVERLPEPREHGESPHLLGAAWVDGALVGIIDVKSVLDCVQRPPTR